MDKIYHITVTYRIKRFFFLNMQTDKHHGGTDTKQLWQQLRFSL